jgi:hypothetical protein
VGLSLRKHFVSRKLTNSLPVRNVTARALEKNYLLLFHSEKDHRLPPALQEVAAGPAVDFPEVDKGNGRVPFSESYT